MSYKPTEHFRWEVRDGVAVVEVLSIELNQPRFADEFTAQLRAVLATHGAGQMLINFHNTSSMSSTAFGKLAEFVKAAEEAGVALAFCGMSPSVLMGAEFLCLDQTVPIFADETSALAVLHAEGHHPANASAVPSDQRT